MKSRTLPFVVLLLFVSFLFAAAFRTNARLLGSYAFQIDSELLYIIISAIACGGLIMFFLFSLLPTGKNDREISTTFQISSPGVTALQAALELDDLEKATRLANQLHENDPDYWFARKVAGDLAMKNGDLKQAELCYQEALRRTTGFNRALLFLNMGALFELNNTEQAAAHYREAMRLVPTALEPVVRLRLMAIRDQDWEEALQWQEHLERQFPKILSREDEAMIRAGVRFELASSQFAAGAYKTSLSLLKFVLKINEDFTPAFLIAGNVHEKMQNVSAAMKVWEKGFQRTAHPVLLQRIAESLLSRGFPSEAIEYLRVVTRLYPEDPFIGFCLGDLYRKLEMLEEAIRVFGRLEQTQPEWNFNRLALAEVYQRTGNVRASAAILKEIVSGGDAVSSAPWQCYICNTTYYEYKSFCVECLGWDSINLNQQKAVRMETQYDRPTALPL